METLNPYMYRRIVNARKRKSMEPHELAEALGIQESTLKCYESGAIVPNMTTVRKLAKALDVTEDYLLATGEKYPYRDPLDPDELRRISQLPTDPDAIMPTDRMLASLLTIARIRSGKQPSQLDAETGIPTARWTKFESGREAPTRAELDKICEVLGTSLAELYGIEDDTVPDGKSPDTGPSVPAAPEPAAGNRDKNELSDTTPADAAPMADSDGSPHPVHPPALQFSPALRDDAPAFDGQESALKAIELVTEIMSSLSFFRTLVREGEPRKSDAYTHLSLLEYKLVKLSRLTGYDGMVLKENERRHGEIRAANERIRFLETQLGASVTADTVMTGLRHYEGTLGAWWSACGFRYAEMSVHERGITMKVSRELENKIERGSPFSDRDFVPLAAAVTEFITNSPDYDVHHDQYHSELLDTDRNRERLQALYADTFPNAVVHGFRSHRDSDRYYLDHEVTVTWHDIASWEASVRANTETQAPAEAGTEDTKEGEA